MALELTIGGSARVQGLVGRADLNGRTAKLVRFHEDSGRWEALVSKPEIIQQEAVRIKAQNLIPMEQPRAPDPWAHSMDEDVRESLKAAPLASAGGFDPRRTMAGPNLGSPVAKLLGCWPLTQDGKMQGFASGMMAMPKCMATDLKMELDTLYCCVPDSIVISTLIHVPDDNATVDFTYGNRERLRSFLLTQMHQQPAGRPSQFEHSFIVEENLKENVFWLKVIILPDSVTETTEHFLEIGSKVVFQRTSGASDACNLSFHSTKQEGMVLYECSAADFAKSMTLHERITNQKPR